MLNLVDYGSSDDEDYEVQKLNSSTPIITEDSGDISTLTSIDCESPVHCRYDISETPQPSIQASSNQKSDRKSAQISSFDLSTKDRVFGRNPLLAGLKRSKHGNVCIPTFHADVNSDDDDDIDLKKRRMVLADKSKKSGAAALLCLLPEPKTLSSRDKSKRLIPSSIAKKSVASIAGGSSRIPDQQVHASVSNRFEFHTPPEAQYEHSQAISQLPQTTSLSELDVKNLPKSELQRLRAETGGGITNAVVDIRQDDLVKDIDLTLVKNITSNADMQAHKKDLGSQPSSLSRRKHQITYLAYKAKEREFELKNMWADSKFNKRTSQSKYGF